MVIEGTEGKEGTMSDDISDTPALSFLEIFEAELRKYGIPWCKGECGTRGHKRGFATLKSRIVHYDSKICTRATLQGGLHEIGHIVANVDGMKRWEKEESAERWANDRMRELGISIPRRILKLGKSYVSRWKRFGRNVAAGVKRARQGL